MTLMRFVVVMRAKLVTGKKPKDWFHLPLKCAYAATSAADLREKATLS